MKAFKDFSQMNVILQGKAASYFSRALGISRSEVFKTMARSGVIEGVCSGLDYRYRITKPGIRFALNFDFTPERVRSFFYDVYFQLGYQPLQSDFFVESFMKQIEGLLAEYLVRRA